MPRTKLSKNAKRNRQAVNEELTEILKDVDSTAEAKLAEADAIYNKLLSSIDANINILKNRLPQNYLSKKLFEIESDINLTKQISGHNLTSGNKLLGIASSIASLSSLASLNSISSNGSNEQRIHKSKDDEGYITEDCVTNTDSILPSLPKIRMQKLSTQIKTQNAPGRTSRRLGPLDSAKARERCRRSRSAYACLSENKTNETKQNKKQLENQQDQCENVNKSCTPIKNNKDKLRSISADRGAYDFVPLKIKPNAPISVFRYPKLGETVVSLSGSPIVTQGLADPSGANVNIPVGNGILSLRPTKLDCNDTDTITQHLNIEILEQIKLLKSNLSLIVDFAKKEGL